MKKIISGIFFCCFFFLTFPSNINAQVVINEIFPNPTGTEDGAEWVELFNTTDVVVSLTGCTLYLDDSASTQKVNLDDVEFIDKYETITWSGTWLNNTGDHIRLSCSEFEDIVIYGKDLAGFVIESPSEGWSIGRSPDGSDNWIEFASASINEANPSPTPTPTQSPTPTLTPSPTLTLTLTPSPTPTKKITPTQKLSYSPTDILTEDQTYSAETTPVNILGDSETVEKKDGLEVEDVLGVANTDSKQDQKLPFLAFVFIGLGVILIGVAVGLFLKSKKEGSNNEKEIIKNN